jgi:uncharacterized protein (UPF0248 family)
MKFVVFALLGAVAAAGLFGALASQLRYVLTGRHVKVTLFGLCLRRIRLADIDSVSKRQAYWAEIWYNTSKPSHRILVIRRRRGWFKDFIITPKNRYVFKAELEQALAKVKAAPEEPKGIKN